jgi:peptidoglycan/LPS O-acetylase OafA/YrhL
MADRTLPPENLTGPERVRESLYSPGLDGLRAIAVAAVIVFHFAPSVLPGGFLGVDVFFVVSGFLIARLVVAEIGRSGKVSLPNFWGRRARRLLPALAVLVVGVCIAAAISFTAGELHNVRAQAVGSLFYVANWVMIAGNTNYFATIGRPSPFLHLWTLAVEEQFYIVFPLVCFATRRWIVRKPVVSASVAFVLAITSTVWMSVLVRPGHDPSRAYLGTDSHAMGLLIGVALGVLAGAVAPWDWLRARAARVSVRASIAAAGALVVIVVTMWRATDHTYALYHGGFFVFALLCAVLIVVVVMLPDVWISRALSHPVLVAIGLRSYSLYLWHWPVRVFITGSGFGIFMERLVVSVVLAELSFRFVERPFRTGAIARRTGSRGAIAAFAVLVLLTGVLVGTVAAPEKLPASTLQGCPNPGATRVDVFGDSTALKLGLGGCAARAQLDLSVGGAAQLGCGVVLTDHVSQGVVIPNPAHDCDGWQDRWRTILAQDPNAKIALMVGAWEILDQKVGDTTVKFGTPEWTKLVSDSLRDALGVLTSDGRTVYLFEVPCYGGGDNPTYLPERHDPKRIAALNAIFEQVARDTPHVEMVPWRDLVCPHGKRAEQVNGVHLWDTDDVHLTSAGAQEVWRWLLPKLH